MDTGLKKMEELETLIKVLSDMRGISGFEYRLLDAVAELFRAYADEVYQDNLGNIIAVKHCGRENAKRIMIEGHCDEIGLMVSGIDEDGFLSFVNIGGVDQRVLPACEVIVHGKQDIPGVVGTPPGWMQTEDDQKKSFDLKTLFIDTGLKPERVRELVSIGDSITLRQSCGRLLGGQFSGKTLDDRAGVAAVLMVLRNLQNIKLDVDVYAVAAVQEEVGCRGAKTAAFSIQPDLAVAIDVCHGITPDNSENAFENGSGTIISVGPNIHPKLARRLIETGEEYSVPHQIDVDGGNTGTDAWVIQVAGKGIPTALLSIPLKYMHTCVETLALSDVKATADLLTFFIQNLQDDLEGWLCF